MNSIHSTNIIRFRAHDSLIKGHSISKKDSTVVRLNDGKWLCVRHNGETGRFKVYERIEDWTSELPLNDGLICLTDEATRVEYMKPGSGLKRAAEPKPADEEPKQISNFQIGENILRIISMAELCITTSGRIHYITELMRYLISIPNYVRNHPNFHQTVQEKCIEYMNSEEFMENADLHHAVYQAYTTFA